MRKLLIKILCAVILMAVTCFGFLSYWFFIPAFSVHDEMGFKHESVLEFRLLSQQLKQQPFSNWKTTTANYDSYFALDAKLISASSVPSDAVLLKSKTVQKIPENSRFKLLESDDYMAFFPTSDSQWYIQFHDGESELSPYEDELQTVIFLITSLPLLVLIPMIIGGIYLVNILSQPLLALEKAVLLFANGDTEVRIDSSKNRAISRVCDAFNSMADQVTNTLNEQQLMIAVIPHELRTPINRIRFSLDLCRGQNLAQVMEQLEKLDGFSYELEQAVEDILLLNKLETKQSLKRRLECKSLLLSSCASHLNLPGLETALKTAYIFAHPGLIQRAFDNLLANAQRYATSYVSLASSTTASRLCITIENDCNNVHGDQVAKVFEPFYRSDESRNRDAGGIGIGLTLVKRIVEKEGGSIAVTMPTDGSIKFTLTFPLMFQDIA